MLFRSQRRRAVDVYKRQVFPTRSHTVAAQGGISASLGNMGPAFPVTQQPNVELLKGIISDHQRGLTDYALPIDVYKRQELAGWYIGSDGWRAKYSKERFVDDFSDLK